MQGDIIFWEMLIASAMGVLNVNWRHGPISDCIDDFRMGAKERVGNALDRDRRSSVISQLV